MFMCTRQHPSVELLSSLLQLCILIRNCVFNGSAWKAGENYIRDCFRGNFAPVNTIDPVKIKACKAGRKRQGILLIRPFGQRGNKNALKLDVVVRIIRTEWETLDELRVFDSSRRRDSIA
jgi:hypothetical protein